MQLRIEKIVYPGKSLSRTSGKVVFTDEGLPGELVEIEILKDKKNYAEARTIRVIESSPHRLPPVCSHYLACSPYQIMDYTLELEIKKQQLREIFTGLKPHWQPEIELLSSPAIFGYRNKIRLSLNWQANPPALAYHEPGFQDTYLPVDRCALVSDRVNHLISSLNILIPGTPLPAINHLEIRESFSLKEILLVLESEDEDSLEQATRLWVPALTLSPEVVGVVGISSLGRRKQYLKLYGLDYLEEKIGEVIFRYGAGSFFQVNPPLLEKVVSRMKKYLQALAPVKLVDLYAGLGTFGLLLSSFSSEIMAVESDPNNLYYLKKNLRLNRLQHLRVAEGKSEDWLEEIIDFQPEVVVIDPPRRGLAEELALSLKENPVNLIFYLSCNPATLARDLKRLLPEYELLEITAFDFFPRTPHIETLAVLSRAGKLG